MFRSVINGKVITPKQIQWKVGNWKTLLRRAQDKHPLAAVMVAYLYLEGSSPIIEKDPGVAFEFVHQSLPWLQQEAVGRSNRCAAYFLAYLYENGIVLTQNRRKAFWLYDLSATQNYVMGQCGLGYCYYRGSGVNRSFKEAMKLFCIGISKGNSSARYYAGLCLRNGNGEVKDRSEAFRLWTQAAEQGHCGEIFDCL